MIVSKGDQMYDGKTSTAVTTEFITTAGIIVIVTNREPANFSDKNKKQIEDFIRVFADRYKNDYDGLVMQADTLDPENYIKQELAKVIADYLGIQLAEDSAEEYPDNVLVFIHKKVWDTFKEFGYPVDLNYSMYSEERSVL